MNSNVSDQINSVINNLAEKLGVAIDKVYPILKTQALFDGIFGIFSLVLSIVIFITCCILFIKHWELSTNEFDKHAIIIISTLLICGVSIILTIVNLSELKSYITAIINPDWYILNNLLKDLIQK